jgi:hypothetical protein
VEVILTGEFSRKHPTFPVSLLKHYKESKDQQFPGRSEPTEQQVPFEDEAEKVILKVLNQKMIKLNNKDTRLYLVRYKNKSSDYDEWLPESKIPNVTTLLRKYRVEKKNLP